MVFKHPHLLYGLFFLIVPIIVHLFQLRRFKKREFTNVAFLKPLISQTRKSRQLKKWLSLLARLLVVTCLVLAFAQPFLPAEDQNSEQTETIIYLDNSFSMQTQGSEGTLLNVAVTDLLSSLDADREVTVFTNDQVFRYETRQSLTNQILKLGHTSESYSLSQVKLKAGTLANSDAVRLILLSDFQRLNGAVADSTFTGDLKMVRYVPQETNNLSIDSVFVKKRVNSSVQLGVTISSNYDLEQPVTVSLFNKNLLLAKTSVTLEDQEGEAVFDVEADEGLNAKVSITDNGLKFDNEFYLAYDTSSQIKVLSINGAESGFINRIFKGRPFEYAAYRLKDLNYNLIKDQNLVVLNELETIPASLKRELNAFTSNGGKIIFIPNENGVTGGLTRNFQMVELEKNITRINYDHPVMSDVFNKRVSNFQYPSVQKSARVSAGNAILEYADGSEFLYEAGNTFVFTAPLNVENTNFQSSPLIVPVFYNMAMSSLPLPKLYFQTGVPSEIAIPYSIKDDGVVKFKLDNNELIPRQRSYPNYVQINTEDDILDDGVIEVIHEENTVSQLAFNYPRSENELRYLSDNQLGGNTANNLEEVFTEIAASEEVTTLWRWFLYGALFFLICEILILKYLK
ncbi:alpha-1-antitrypsin [Nonlabens spongiae]|uniref:Alpha-1-antitrypsin n=1 Tax=Nonlabens spongiae TaxID=331648 RepID=A0A1W6MN89_9FLAO|nr:BatA domain-containing protein [Nonlabens spongiae]ARN79058.1 alpha-1-antitrypsin [Nonlabens spongiae]